MEVYVFIYVPQRGIRVEIEAYNFVEAMEQLKSIVKTSDNFKLQLRD